MIEKAIKKMTGGILSANISTTNGAKKNCINNHQRAKPIKWLKVEANIPLINAKLKGASGELKYCVENSASKSAASCMSNAIIDGGSFFSIEVNHAPDRLRLHRVWLCRLVFQPALMRNQLQCQGHAR